MRKTRPELWQSSAPEEKILGFLLEKRCNLHITDHVLWLIKASKYSLGFFAVEMIYMFLDGLHFYCSIY